MEYAKSKDVVTAIATGNDSASNPAYPAIYASDDNVKGYVIAVASVSSSDVISSFSNKCGTAKNYCLVAPGENIHAAYPTSSYADLNGTSMATPSVAGAAAVIRGAWPSLTADQVVSLLLTTATDLGTSGVDDTYGYGMLNLYDAVKPVGSSVVSSGTSTDSAGYDISTTSLTVDPIFGDAFSTNVAAALNNTVFFDSYGRDFKANINTKIGNVSSYNVPTLDNIAFNNYTSNSIPLSFGKDSSSQLKFQVKSYNSNSETGNGLDRGYSQNRYGLKFLINDRSQEDRYLTSSNGFSFTENFSNKFKAGFAFNTN
ncbi:MAG: S8 family serine peptidase [Rickettsiales bacterium]|nr:S8 family serine peptidase [Rickettsiales bacterium]